MVVYTPRKKIKHLSDSVEFILEDVSTNNDIDYYVTELEITNINLYKDMRDIFHNNTREGVSSHLYLTNIHNISKKIRNRDKLFATDKNIYITTDISTDDCTYINGNRHIVFARLCFNELESSKSDISDINIDIEDKYNKKTYPIEIQSIEQLKHFYIYIKKIEDTEERLSFEEPQPKLKFEFKFK